MPDGVSPRLALAVLTFVDPYFSLRFPGWRRSVSLWSFALDRDFGLWSRRQHLTLIGMRLLPKLPGKAKGVDLEAFPPGNFIAGLMELRGDGPGRAER